MVVTAIIPLKALARAKGRLADELDAAERATLVAWMFERVVGACLEAACVDEIVVVAGDHDAVEAARRHPVRVLADPGGGLNAALRSADAATRGSVATLVVAADLPFVTASELDAVCAAAGVVPGRPERPGDEPRAERCVVVAPTDDGGTGALLRRPPDVLAPAYGPGSAQRHLVAARASRVAIIRLDLPGLAADVDTPDQLRRMRLRAGELS